MARASYFATMARRASGLTPVLAPQRMLMRGWETSWPPVFDTAASVSPAAVISRSAAPMAAGQTEDAPAVASAKPSPPSGIDTPAGSEVRMLPLGRADTVQAVPVAGASDPPPATAPAVADGLPDRLPDHPVRHVSSKPPGPSDHAFLRPPMAGPVSPVPPPSMDPVARYAAAEPLRLSTASRSPPDPAKTRTVTPSDVPTLLPPALQMALDWVAQPAGSARPSDARLPESGPESGAAERIAMPGSPPPRARAAEPALAEVAHDPRRHARPAPPPSPASPPNETPRTVHIGSIDIQIEPERKEKPPAPAQAIPPARPAAPPSVLARGFTTPLGLRQG